MISNYNKSLKSNSVNKSISLNKNKNPISFNNNIVRVSKDLIQSSHRVELSNHDFHDKKLNNDVFPRIDSSKLNKGLDGKKTSLSNFNMKSNSLKKGVMSELASRDISYEGDSKIQLQNFKVKPIALMSNRTLMKSNNNSPRGINQDKIDLSGDNIFPTKNMNFINIYSNRSKESSKSKVGFKEEGNVNLSMEHNLKNGKSFNADNSNILNIEREEMNTSQLQSKKQSNNSFIHNSSHKSASPISHSKTTKETSLSSIKLNKIKPYQQNKIEIDSLEELHFVYNNLFRQNRELAHRFEGDEDAEKIGEIEL